MSSKNKKRILTLALVIALLSIVMVGGSLAWFTDNDSAKNTFTVGSVEIKQIEQQYNENGELEDFENGKHLLPIVDTATPSDDTNYQHKIVTVKNEGKNAAYVRTYIAVPLKLKDYICIDVDGTGWIQEKVEPHGNLFVYTYRYDSRVEPGLDTEVLLKGVSQ